MIAFPGGKQNLEAVKKFQVVGEWRQDERKTI